MFSNNNFTIRNLTRADIAIQHVGKRRPLPAASACQKERVVNTSRDAHRGHVVTNHVVHRRLRRVVDWWCVTHACTELVTKFAPRQRSWRNRQLAYLNSRGRCILRNAEFLNTWNGICRIVSAKKRAELGVLCETKICRKCYENATTTLHDDY